MKIHTVGKLVIFVAVATLEMVPAVHSLRGNRTPEALRCRIFIDRSTVLTSDNNVSDGYNERYEHEFVCARIVQGIEDADWTPINLPEGYAEDHLQEIHRGDFVIDVEGADLKTYPKQIIIDEATKLSVVKDVENVIARERHLSSISKGQQSVLFIRVSTIDASPNTSVPDLAKVFDPDIVNMKTQYNACSFGQLDFTCKGVWDIQVDRPISDFDRPIELALAAEEAYQGFRTRVDGDFSSVAEKVFFCLPKEVNPNWKASSAPGHWRALFSDEWCTSLSATMHEMAHTMSLFHASTPNDPYGDKTDYLGSGVKDASFPRKCFNGFHAWSLGWYEERHLRVDPSVDGQSNFQLASFVDFPETSSTESVVVNIMDKYYLVLNAARSFNEDTGDQQNLVTVTQAKSHGSLSVAGLGEGDHFEVQVEVETVSNPSNATLNDSTVNMNSIDNSTLSNGTQASVSPSSASPNTVRTLIIKVCDRFTGEGGVVQGFHVSVGFDSALCQ